MKRRSFLKNSLVFTGGLSLAGTKVFAIAKDLKYISHRPESSKRNFVSSAVNQKILEVKKAISNQELSWMFENCFPNTLDTTVTFSEEEGKLDSFVITGDIHAMWLRDSTAQVWPYLPLVNEDLQLQRLFQGLINRQTKCINIDPYANAFNRGADGSYWESDQTVMKPELHERKWEIDSLCYTIRLAYHYWKKTNDISCFDTNWANAMKAIVRTFKEQQRKENQGPYRFLRNTSKSTDTLPGDGYGNPIKPVGLIVSSFRPSDDSTILPFLIPSNYFAVVSLKQMAEMLNHLNIEKALAESAIEMSKEIEESLSRYASSNHLNRGETLAFEVDGFGNQLYMDDANIPSLLSLPYLGAIDANSKLYQNTRKFILSENNPWFFVGKYANGIGGPHVGMNMIWPMSIIMQAITSDNNEEIVDCLKILMRIHAGTGFMHESFHKDDPKNFTRSWFAWANTLFGELILKIYNERPQLLKIV